MLVAVGWTADVSSLKLPPLLDANRSRRTIELYDEVFPEYEAYEGNCGGLQTMKIDWDNISTDLTTEQLESAYEPVGRFILIHTQFDLLLGRLVAALSGLGGNQVVQHLLAALDAVNKKRIIESVASIYGSDPNNLVLDYRPVPELKRRLKSVATAFETSSKVRNVLAHGTLGRLGDNVFIGSMSAAYFFKNTGGAESWVFIEEIDEHVIQMLTGMDQGTKLQREFLRLHERGIAEERNSA